MDPLIDLSWRIYPAAALVAAGTLLAIRETPVFIRGFQPSADGPARLLAGMRGFRRAVVRLALAGIGAAWLWQSDWILALSLVIGGVEWLESSWHVQALRLSERAHRDGQRPGRAARVRLSDAGGARPTAGRAEPNTFAAAPGFAPPPRRAFRPRGY